eukprot:CAMPEP_0180525358 /NCGR_PEP_ID=MMETSP1036_2-20121128/59123_1 /TAXON_ID=632150 /ORGANISM="Azadinium spinosum, Strain 3D9" /LENGTH=107 /DNA_ID=CAMNT_0022538647 /DNA_START=143 /DNA_END=466 /DNA_ORIENTATION=-
MLNANTMQHSSSLSHGSPIQNPHSGQGLLNCGVFTDALPERSSTLSIEAQPPNAPRLLEKLPKVCLLALRRSIAVDHALAAPFGVQHCRQVSRIEGHTVRLRRFWQS